MNLTEADDIKKRWQEYTAELCKKHLHDPDNHEHSPRMQSQMGISKHHYGKS